MYVIIYINISNYTIPYHRYYIGIYVLLIYRPTFAPKTSLAGLPSAIPSRPLKENKTKIIPNYKKKARQGREDEDEDDVDDQDVNTVVVLTNFITYILLQICKHVEKLVKRKKYTFI